MDGRRAARDVTAQEKNSNMGLMVGNIFIIIAFYATEHQISGTIGCKG